MVICRTGNQKPPWAQPKVYTRNSMYMLMVSREVTNFRDTAVVRP